MFLPFIRFYLELWLVQNMGQNEEKELLEKIAAGDHVAFTTLFDNYHHSLGAFVFSITKSKELAEEITLDVFLKIWMTREALAEVKNFKAYLFTVSRNAAIVLFAKLSVNVHNILNGQKTHLPNIRVK
jgi:RNA polymerase sigma-70 factor (ECF subfamily)